MFSYINKFLQLGQSGMKSIGLSKLWNSLRSSYWFLPGLMALGGIALAFIALALDQAVTIKTGFLKGLLYQGGPDGARAVLSAVASSMITVVATAFSITIVALQLATANFGPRLLRNFMKDLGNQIVLGTFIATFLYCLLVLRRIYGEDYDPFVPAISVTIGIVLSFASIGVLIYFIHHASTIIQASHVIVDVVADLNDAIKRLFPEKIGQSKVKARRVAEIPQDFESQACPIQLRETGYLQAIDNQLLLKLASEHNLLIELKFHPGKFVVEGNTAVLIYPEKQVNQKLVNQINRTFIVGRERTKQQDIEFPLDQLVEIALRALSPGINDPFTAVRCIDRLSAGLSCLAEREFPSRYRYDEDGELRVIAEPVTFEHLVNIAFNQIRHYGKSDVVVMVRLLDAIAQIALRIHHDHDRFVLQKQADVLLQSSYEGLSQKYDQELVEKHYNSAIALLNSW